MITIFFHEEHEGTKNTKNFSLFVTFVFFVSSCLLFLFALPVLAQESVTADDVNAVAKRLYCPVCENQPLDTCMTEACIRWRDEIRVQLEAGRTPDQVVEDFVMRFGERAIGTPLDPALRTLTLLTPFILAGIALVVGVFTFTRWRGNNNRPTTDAVYRVPTSSDANDDDDYRSQVERDLRL